MALSSKDYKILLELIDIAYAIPDWQKMLHTVLDKLQGRVPFSSSVFMPIEQTTRNFRFQDHVAFNSPSKPIFLFADYYAPLHPITVSGILPQDHINRPISITDVISPSSLPNTEYGTDFQPLTPIFYEMCLVLGSQGDPVGALGLHRRKRDRDFTDREKTFLTLLTPHLSRALRNLFLERDRFFYDEVGVIVLSPNGKLNFINEEALRALNGRAPDAVPDLGYDATPVFFRTEIGNYRVRTILVQADTIGATVLSRWVPVSGIPQLDPFIKPGTTGKIKITLLEKLPTRSNLRQRLTRFGLSTRQEEIAILVIRGFSNREIAGRLFIAEQTVKDHLHDIFEKIKVRRRSELIAKVLGI